MPAQLPAEALDKGFGSPGPQHRQVFPKLWTEDNPHPWLADAQEKVNLTPPQGKFYERLLKTSPNFTP
jgi:hypothetical protein